ncbi:hypothetical protein LC653_42695 [Nostoc sp. CHAB 5784]|uniref:hypothetical protein n=1 Tax=Nostoc mirabile TaxID=2907820 RepID=UPI001E614FDE|nr:hypothetical protein [Nostoc mirabile]MCC5670320.1 hypothetical protein [Nostoc mirabile CHAB5784]
MAYEYKTQRRRLALAQAPRQRKRRLHHDPTRQRKRRLHHDPISVIQDLVNQHTELLTVLESQALKYQLDS